MKKIGVAILGLGVVGGGTYKILTEHREFYQKNHNVDITVECVLERNKEKAVALGIDESKIVNGIAEVVSNPDVDIVVETLGGIEPAKSFILAALNAGMSIVTANKELYSKYGYELEKMAKKNNCGLFFEASCAGGVPVIRSLLDSLQGNVITSIMGIINGTTNYILTKMSECGASYDEALNEAQKLGYAEADPTADVEGFDAAYKLSILSSIAFHTKVPYTEIYREGITKISAIDVEYGKQMGYAIKLLAIGKNGKNGIEVRVHPVFVAQNHPLASVNDSFNAVFVTGDSVGDIMLYGRGAGALPTGSAIVGDIIYCASHEKFNYSTFKNTENGDPATKFVKNFESAYYLRLNVEDKVGVLSKVMAIFSRHGISVSQAFQPKNDNGVATLIVVTHVTREHYVEKAIAEINDSKENIEVAQVIRVE